LRVRDSTGTDFLGGITAIAGGVELSLALNGDGFVWAWGQNGNGQLGNGTNTLSTLPVQVKDSAGTGFLSGVAAIAAGSEHSLAMKGGGSVWAWGYNGSGQFGNGTFSNVNLLPVQASINLGSSVPPDQGNVLHAIKLADGATWDVVLDWTGTGALTWRIYRDTDKSQLGTTALPPDATVVNFVDAGRVPPVAGVPCDFYRVRGLSPCSATPGP
jgi:alpha-tubulin suppressor-like RCC1 family protein